MCIFLSLSVGSVISGWARVVGAADVFGKIFFGTSVPNSDEWNKSDGLDLCRTCCGEGLSIGNSSNGFPLDVVPFVMLVIGDGGEQKGHLFCVLCCVLIQLRLEMSIQIMLSLSCLFTIQNTNNEDTNSQKEGALMRLCLLRRIKMKEINCLLDSHLIINYFQ